MNCSRKRNARCPVGQAGPAVAAAGPPADGENRPVRLTTDGRFKRDPVFWPGGQELIYAASTPVTVMISDLRCQEGRVGLQCMRWADRTVGPCCSKLDKQLLPLSTREPCVSADGSIFAYCQRMGNMVIVVEDLQRRRKVTIKRAGELGGLNRPTLSSDGQRIVFMRDSNRLVAFDLWKDDARDMELGVEGDLRPNFSPDGRHIVFSSRRDRDYEIYVMNADGSDQRRLTHSRGIDTNPVFSPDGRRIAFTSNRDGNYQIYVMDADGGNPRWVTRSSERSDFPCWHPDGKHLVFVGERNGRFDLYLVDAPG
jgi:Tol biopolymer transport system component